MLDNLESIIKHGLLCTNLKNERAIDHKNIAAQGIQERRSNTMVTNTTNIHDYVPFYFAKKTPLHLGLLNTKNIDQICMIFFAIPLSVITEYEGVRFTTRSANTNDMPFFFSRDQLEKLDEINWDVVDSRKWGYSGLEKNQKMAELLIPQKVSVEMIDHIIVWNDSVEEYVTKKISEKGISCPDIRFHDKYDTHYFCKIGTNESLIIGPGELCRRSKSSILRINEKSQLAIYKDIESKPTSVYDDIEFAFDDVQKKLSSYLNKAKNVSITYNNRNDNLYDHLQRVKSNLDDYDEYNSLGVRSKEIVSLAAILHDIGKLQSNMNPPNVMSQADNDHPARALSILEDIFEGQTQYNPDEIRILVMLVVYHDLIGDIIKKGRDEDQLTNLVKEKLITSEQELNMLLALSYADIQEYKGAFVFSPFEVENKVKIANLQETVFFRLNEIEND